MKSSFKLYPPAPAPEPEVFDDDLLDVERSLGRPIPAFSRERPGDDLAVFLEAEIADPSKRARLAHVAGCAKELARREMLAYAIRLLDAGKSRAAARRYMMVRFPELSRSTTYRILAKCLDLHCQQMRLKAAQPR